LCCYMYCLCLLCCSMYCLCRLCCFMYCVYCDVLGIVCVDCAVLCIVSIVLFYVLFVSSVLFYILFVSIVLFHVLFVSSVLFYMLFVSIVLFYVLFMCKCVLYYCHWVSTQLQLTNISYRIICIASVRFLWFSKQDTPRNENLHSYYTNVYSDFFFSCGAAAQRGPLPQWSVCPREMYVLTGLWKFLLTLYSTSEELISWVHAAYAYTLNLSDIIY